MDRLFYLVCQIFFVPTKNNQKRFCGFLLFLPPKGLKFFHYKLSIQWDFHELTMCQMLLIQRQTKTKQSF